MSQYYASLGWLCTGCSMRLGSPGDRSPTAHSWTDEISSAESKSMERWFTKVHFSCLLYSTLLGLPEVPVEFVTALYTPKSLAPCHRCNVCPGAQLTCVACIMRPLEAFSWLPIWLSGKNNILLIIRYWFKPCNRHPPVISPGYLRF